MEGDVGGGAELREDGAGEPGGVVREESLDDVGGLVSPNAIVEVLDRLVLRAGGDPVDNEVSE
jgi:hypothetical protein